MSGKEDSIEEAEVAEEAVVAEVSDLAVTDLVMTILIEEARHKGVITTATEVVTEEIMEISQVHFYFR